MEIIVLTINKTNMKEKTLMTIAMPFIVIALLPVKLILSILPTAKEYK